MYSFIIIHPVNSAFHLVITTEPSLTLLNMSTNRQTGSAAAPRDENGHLLHLDLIAKSTGKIDIYFKVSATTKISTIMRAYGHKFALSPDEFRFLFRDQALDPDQTVSDYGMENGDEIIAEIDE